MRKQEFDHRVLKQQMKSKNQWWYRALVLSKRLKRLGHSTDDVFEAYDEELETLLKQEVLEGVLNGSTDDG